MGKCRMSETDIEELTSIYPALMYGEMTKDELTSNMEITYNVSELDMKLHVR